MFITSFFLLLCCALAVLCLGVVLPGMAMATSRHEPPRYDQAGHGDDLWLTRPEGMSRPEGTAMQTKPGTDMICD
jgi:hypothetical protein